MTKSKLNAKQVRETNAGKSISAWMVFDKQTHKEVATIHAHFSDAGNVRVDIFTPQEGLTYQGKAGGYGYDKLTAALTGAVVGGYELTDHCQVKLPPLRPNGLFLDSDIIPRDYRRANWNDKRGGYTDCYKDAGIRGLEYFFDVYQVI